MTKMNGCVKKGKSLIMIMLIILLCFATFPLGGCSNESNEEPLPSLNPYLEQINTNAQSVNVQLPWSRGINFNQWFEATSPDDLNFLRYSEQDFIDVKNMGVEAIRVPIRFHDMAGGAPSYTLDSKFLRQLDMVVDWAERHELYLILDNHSWSPTDPTDEGIASILIPVWRQIALRYLHKSDYLIYELKNEPHGISNDLWLDIQGEVLKEVKTIDPLRSVIVTGADFGGVEGMLQLPKYPYEKVIYTFHFYDPYIFTHQGETWSEPPRLTSLKNLPFPADAHEMPPLPQDLKGTWIEHNYNDYHNVATIEALERNLDRAVTFANEHNVAIFCGEFGVHMPNVMHEDRVRWYEITVRLFEIRSIARASWDYYGGFGIFENADSLASTTQRVNIEIVKALGLQPLNQDVAPIVHAFSIYDYAPNTQLVRFNFYNSKLDFFELANNEYALEWGNAKHYGLLEVLFRREIDWQLLAQRGYALSLRVRAKADAKFQVRFVNTEKAGYLPWRRAIDIELSASENWVDIIVPLSQMQETGAWSNIENSWITPSEREDGFDWNRVYALQIVAEYADLLSTVQFECIKIE